MQSSQTLAPTQFCVIANWYSSAIAARMQSWRGVGHAQAKNLAEYTDDEEGEEGLPLLHTQRMMMLLRHTRATGI